MHFFHASLLLLNAAGTLVIALPQDTSAAAVARLSETHRIHQEAAGLKHPGPVALAKAIAKYNGTVPQHISRAASEAASRQVGCTDAEPGDQNDINWLSKVSIGATQFRLEFDTGSPDLWVFSSLLSADQQLGHSVYEMGGTRIGEETFDITYADGTGASGIVYADTVTVGAIATTQAVGAATFVASDLVGRPADGILGLSFDSVSTCQPEICNTFMDRINSTLPQPIFTSTMRHQAPGEFDFGFVDTNKYTGDLTVVEPNDKSSPFWTLTSGGYSIGDGNKTSYQMDCIADTGTTLLIVDADVAKDYYAAVSGAENQLDQGGWIFPCDSHLPNFGLWMGGKQHTMPGIYANYSTVGDGSDKCYGGIQAADDLGCIVGGTFLKSQYVVWNYESHELSFAQQNGVKL